MNGSNHGNTLSKAERLSDKNSIGKLVREGRYGKIPGMKYCFIEGNGLACNRIMISVPKRFFKRAVKRNLLKRRIRESYRQQKGLVGRSGVDILFMYQQKEIMDYGTIYQNIGKILSEIQTNHVGTV